MSDTRFVWALSIPLLCVNAAQAGDPATQCPVLLTFDVEIESDIEALKQLDPPGSCTLFVTGEFAQAHPDVVRGWAKQHEIACHTTSHPHLPQLDFARQLVEIRDSAEAIRKAAGLSPIGFRAPYLESNNLTREALVRLGFRYQSSAWEINHRDRSDAHLLEFPISDGQYRGQLALAGDYNLFEGARMSDEDALSFLFNLYDEHRRTGRPLVILLHPNLAAAHAIVIKRFIDRVKQAGASWTCFRDWMRDAGNVPVEHRAAWVNIDVTAYKPEDLVRHARRLGLTDLFITAYDSFDGALFGPGREYDAFFSGMIVEAHRAGIRVHAWFPICYDPLRLKNRPEWGMVDTNGRHSAEWICPTNAAWRQELLAMFKDLLDHYGVDGIHFDYLRFPDAKVCKCSSCRQALARKPAVDWPLGNGLDGLDKEATWLDYRSELIRGMAEEFTTAIRKWREGVVVSAALKPEGAINFDGVKRYGQSYRELAPLFDFVAPMAYHQLEGEPVDWVRAVQISARWRSGSTPVWHGIQAYQASEHPPMGLGEFGLLLDSMGSGSKGVALFALGPVLSLGTDEDTPFNMPRGADDLVRRWALGQTVVPTAAAAPATRPALVDPSARLAGATARDASRESIIPSWLWGLMGGASAVTLLWFVRARSNRPEPTFPDMPLSVLKALASEPELTGAQADLIVRRLAAVRPVELDVLRAAQLLSGLIEAGGRLRIEETMALDPSDLTIGKAREAGWIRHDGQTWYLTSEGRRLLEDRASSGDLRPWIHFVEERLGESLLVACPKCGAELAGLWLRPALSCRACHIRFPIHESPAVTVRARQGSNTPPASSTL